MRRLIFNTDQINRYGYRLLPSGLDLTSYKNNPVLLGFHDGQKLPIGRLEDFQLSADKSNWSAIPVFDEKDEVALRFKQKWEDGFLHAASVRAYWDDDKMSVLAEHLLPNQSRPTVLEWQCLEVSLVTLPGDPGAAVGNQLSYELPDQLDIILPKIQIKQIMDYKSIADKLGLEKADEQNVLNAIDQLQAKLSGLENARVDALIERGKQLGVINDDNEKSYLSLAKANYGALSAIIHNAPKPEAREDQLSIQAMLEKLASGKSVKTEDKLSFDYLQKHNPTELKRIKAEEPEKYAQLSAEYLNSKTV